MAFTTRASKDVGSALLQHGDTPPEVGPGSYALDNARHAHTAPAPFQSTADRSPVVRPDAAAMPGPGSYSSSMQSRQAAAQRMLAREQAPAFASAVDRFAADKATPAFTPGPGAYKPRQPWTKGTVRRHSAPCDRTRPNHLHMAASRQLLAGPTAPTIPAPHQSYGYEKAQNGSWVLQPPPAIQADASDAQRPSSSSGAASSSRGGTAWGASKTARLVSRTNAVPGPGTYTADDSGQHTRWHVDGRGRLSFAGGRPGIAPPAKGTSSFTTVSRNLEGPAEPEAHPPLHTPTPGPGAYQLPPSFRPTTDPNRTSQPFFMVSRRSDTFGAGSSGSSMPGPGAYAAPSAFAGSSSSGHVGVGGTPFMSMAQRFSGAENTTPGPGNYATQDLLGISQEVSKKLASKHGTFGPSSQRLTAGRAAVAGKAEAAAEEAAGLSVVEGTPGPGSHDVAVVAVQVRDAGRASAAFASGTQRFKTRPSAASAAKAPAMMAADAPDALGGTSSSASCGADAGAGLGPGHYKLPDEWAAQKAAARSHRKAPFGSQTDRFAVPGTRQPTSSPGDAADVASLAAPSRGTSASRRPYSGLAARKPGFASGGTRFQSHETASPGPVAYTVDAPVGHSGFVKRSFNVTVDGW